MALKVYISGMSGNKEVKKRQQRVLMILDSKNIKYDIVDITEPGKESEKELMQTKSTSNGATVSDREPRHPLPPQIFNDDEYCGDYNAFDLANEIDTLEQFLKLAPADTTSVSSAQIELKKTPSQDQNGEAASGDTGNGENKENLEQDTKTSGDSGDTTGGEKNTENGGDAINETDHQQADENTAEVDADDKSSNDKTVEEKSEDKTSEADDKEAKSENTTTETVDKPLDGADADVDADATSVEKVDKDKNEHKDGNENAASATDDEIAKTADTAAENTEVVKGEEDSESVKVEPVLETSEKVDATLEEGNVEQEEKKTDEAEISRETEINANTESKENIESKKIEGKKESVMDGEESLKEDTLSGLNDIEDESSKRQDFKKNESTDTKQEDESAVDNKKPAQETKDQENINKEDDEENDTSTSSSDEEEDTKSVKEEQ